MANFWDKDMPQSVNFWEKDIPQFEIIGFNCGSTPIKRTPITIATIML